ncbi:small subunit ribosomal protein S1 [Paenibacillus sp. PastF-3]|uniref:S1 RNA-binding domain-containing protein n=1 Tax=Paenibacillus sp. PastF-3 TaxID=2940626 RepID=UPI002476D593|nr:S1 RNA-binding domain-containing protein [Paenibacillus sp. PastF-3]MDH6374267.1 small subunit ribosomal protein S1 [Paenibacillus sp. PastF-3]
MNMSILGNNMLEYKTSLRRKMIHQGVVKSIETHSPFGEPMQCAIIELKNGLKGMIHENQFDKHKFRSLVGFLDHKIDYMVLDVTKQGLDPKIVNVFDEEKGIILLSRIQALEELQEDFWENVEVNHVCPAVVSGFEEERFYVMIKGVSCVLPIRDYEYDWTPSARNVIPLGSEITVKIKEIDHEKKRVIVSRKELMEDPWTHVHENFRVNDFHTGVITSVVENIGIFVKLAPGIESLAWFPNRVPSHGDLVGMTVSVMIKNVQASGKRIRSKIIKFPHHLY